MKRKLRLLFECLIPPLDCFKSDAKLDAESKEGLRYCAIEFAKKRGCHKNIRFDK